MMWPMLTLVSSLYFNKHQCYKHEPLSSSIFFSIAQGKEAKTAIKKSKPRHKASWGDSIKVSHPCLGRTEYEFT